MHDNLAAAAANCSTGTWQQKWDCGWNQPVTGAAHAGQLTGHSIPVAVAAVILLILIVIVAKRAKSARPSPAKTAARR
jgi:hypothetical protein